MQRTTPSEPHPSTSAGAEADIRSRRPEVVRRLLALGVSAYTLEMLLPEWSPMIAAAQPFQSGNPT